MPPTITSITNYSGGKIKKKEIKQNYKISK